MSTEKIHPVILTILDGWGNSNNISGNAVLKAKTPFLDSLLQNYPNTLLDASGTSVGLPEGQVGNSEVGHTTIGAGRVLSQDLVKISQSIEDNTFFLNPILNQLCQTVESNHQSLHLIGLCSDGGVHSHIDHLFALISLAQKYKIVQIYIHVITDGRDTSQYSALSFLEQIEKFIANFPNTSIATIVGRYYAMDRDCRWNRTEQAYNTLTKLQNLEYQSSLTTLTKLYADNISDEFILPTKTNEGIIHDGDGVIFFNYRPDRMRQLLQAFVTPAFQGFERIYLKKLNIVTFTQYISSLQIPVVFPPNQLNNFLGEVISTNLLRQFRISETEKYAHVTYFFNGGVEEPFPGEDRELIPSPKVATYDETPSMSSPEITNSLINAINKQCYSLIVVNYANLDMLGHTGNFDAAVQAIENVDKHIGQIIDSVGKVNGTLIITADHGNVECMEYSDGTPHTSHTTNLVPFILVEGEGNKIMGHGANVKLLQQGSLTDIAPTILDILKLQQPVEMTGKSLLAPTYCETRFSN
uniref:2,3-bisphosphoglycerate-independent phosphoglycerate mutase n=1 Tax=Rhodochaete parvula TaxID=110510 RepID=A0A1X9PUW5_9RHOD|nr:2 3-bisphosphoglycerate independent phosphoglycerate mutase [Rhodochaete parvula]